MIKREILKKSEQVKLTFVQPYDNTQPKVSVVGNFNGWDPTAAPLIKRSNGMASVSVTLPIGQRVVFRYVTQDNQWFNDDAADAYESSEHGSENCIIVA